LIREVEAASLLAPICEAAQREAQPGQPLSAGIQGLSPVLMKPVPTHSLRDQVRELAAWVHA
jgi:hypothetical protein